MKLEDLKDYNLVWSEEFDGESLNDTKLTFNEDVLPTKNEEGVITYDYCGCQKVAAVKDGKLILNCFFDLFHGRIRISVAKILQYAAGEQMRCLQDISNIAVEP
jgi:hypothetical protein